MAVGKFSHCFYDDLSETIFLYFHNTTILTLSDDKPEFEVEEVAVYLSPDEYESMRKYFIDHPTKESIL